MGKILKIGLGLLLIGVGIIAVFAALSKDSVFAITNDEDYVYHELSYDSNTYKDINFDLNNRNIYILPSSDDQIRIEYYDTEKVGINPTSNGTTLDLVSDRIPWYDTIFTGWTVFTNQDYFKVYLYLPTSTTPYDLNLDTSNGTIDAQDVTTVSNMTLHTSNGKISCERMDINIFNGTTSNGQVSFEDFTVASTLNVSTSNGKMYFTNVSGTDLDGSSSNGNVYATNVEFNNIDLSSSNGKVTALVVGTYDDYRVHMSTSNGDKTLNGIKVDQNDFNTSKTNKVDLRTSNGDIELDFTE